jgi:hypothetical protein
VPGNFPCPRHDSQRVVRNVRVLGVCDQVNQILGLPSRAPKLRHDKLMTRDESLFERNCHRVDPALKCCFSARYSFSTALHRCSCRLLIDRNSSFSSWRAGLELARLNLMNGSGGGAGGFRSIGPEMCFILRYMVSPL